MADLGIYISTLETVFAAILGLFGQVLSFLISNPITLFGRMRHCLNHSFR